MPLLNISRLLKASTLVIGLSLAGCQGGIDSIIPKAERPVPDRLIKAMKSKGMPSRAPIAIRIFKEESTLEVWKKKDNGRYALLESFEICKWSGKLGPKFKEGDRQAPEGFYTVGPAQMNPKSSYHLSFNMGYPNRFDRSHGRTGSHLMVHGACSSAGCYSMTDELVEEIYALAREAFKGGQRKFQIQAYPFRMTPENMARHKDNKHFEFWKTLKKGNDHFIVSQYPPKVDVCEKGYVFNRVVDEGTRFRSKAQCPTSTIPARLETAYLEKHNADQIEFVKILEKVEKKAKLEALFKSKQPTPKPEPVDAVVATSADSSEAANTTISPPSTDSANTPPAGENELPSDIPIKRPVPPGEIASPEAKKPAGLLSWIKDRF